MVELIETQLAAINAANLAKVSLNAGLRSGEVTHLDRTSKYQKLISKIGRASRELELARKKVAYELANADDGFKDGNSDWLILSIHRAENALKSVTEQAKAIKAAVEEGHALYIRQTVLLVHHYRLRPDSGFAISSVINQESNHQPTNTKCRN